MQSKKETWKEWCIRNALASVLTTLGSIVLWAFYEEFRFFLLRSYHNKIAKQYMDSAFFKLDNPKQKGLPRRFKKLILNSSWNLHKHL